MRSLAHRLVLALPFVLPPTAAAQDWGAIEGDIQSLVQRWGVPGVAVGVVRDGEVLWKTAVGVRRAGNDERVDSQTLFDIGSISKCLTAAAVMMLVEEGRLELDAPFLRCSPEYRFPSADLDERVSLRDMLSHRTGIGSDNVMFWDNDVSRAKVLERARFLPITAGLGESFQYNNIMFVAAGEALGEVAGVGWESFVGHRIFDALGMERTRATRRLVGDLDNQAHPHQRFGREWRPIPFIDLDNAAPAGSIVSCVDDMLVWARMLLAGGRHQDARMLTTSSLQEMWTSNIVVPKGDAHSLMAPLSEQLGYGLGFLTHEYGDQFVVEHAGQSDGMHSELFLIPDLELGIVVLTNGLNVLLPHSIVYRIVDDILDRPLEPAQSAFWASWQQMGPSMTATEFTVPGGAQPIDEHQLSRMPGSYESGLYGAAEVRAADGHLTLELLGREVRMHHTNAGRFAPDWGDDLFMTVSVPRVTFRQGTERAGDRLVLRRVSFSRTR